MTQSFGWKPIPLSLKILFGVFVFWTTMSLMRLTEVYATGVPLFGTMMPGIASVLMLLLLDVVWPVSFLYALWNRLSWGPCVAYLYNGIFILNSVVALFTVRELLGLPQIAIPSVVSLIFVGIIYWNREYFRK
jgi:hypothetical protein